MAFIKKHLVLLIAAVVSLGVLGYAVPPAWRAQLDGGRWFGFLIGFGLVALWLRRTPEPDASSR